MEGFVPLKREENKHILYKSYQGTAMDNEDLKIISNQSLIESLVQMQTSMQNKIDALDSNSKILLEKQSGKSHCITEDDRDNSCEFALVTGQICGLQFARRMLDAILSLK